MAYYFCHCMSLPVCLGKYLFLIAVSAIFFGGGGGGGGGRICPFGFLLVVF